MRSWKRLTPSSEDCHCNYSPMTSTVKSSSNSIRPNEGPSPHKYWYPVAHPPQYRKRCSSGWDLLPDGRLDECEEKSREAFLVSFKKLAKALVANIKILTICRPILEIEDILTFDDGTLRVNADFSKFIEFEINELAHMRKSWSEGLVQEIRETL